MENPETIEDKINSLNEKEMEIFSLLAIDQYDQSMPKTILSKLEEIGLIASEPKMRKIHKNKIAYKQYSMPTAVHIAFCEWCAKNVDDE